MTRYNADNYSDWQLKVHRLLGEGFGTENIAIDMPTDINMVRHEVRRLRKCKMLVMVLKHWATPAIIYGGKND